MAKPAAKPKDPSLRSHLPIGRGDLLRLLALARSDREAYFREHPDWAIYRARVICTALCQGAAVHFATGKGGINDFDLYTFYAAAPARKWYAKRLKKVDFGDPKFGRSQESPKGFVGRRVDLQGRALDVPPGTAPALAVRQYLRHPSSDTARHLAQKAVVLLEPEPLLGTVIWPE
jgi:hypothetical protein